MSIDELNELTEKGYITKVGEYEAAKAAASSYTVESAANKKDFVDATSYADVKDQIDTDYTITITLDVPTGVTDCKATGAGKYDKGAKATLKATAGATTNFAGWYLGESLKSSDATYKITVNSTAEYTAKFEELPPVTSE